MPFVREAKKKQNIKKRQNKNIKDGNKKKVQRLSRPSKVVAGGIKRNSPFPLQPHFSPSKSVLGVGRVGSWEVAVGPK